MSKGCDLVGNLNVPAFSDFLDEMGPERFDRWSGVALKEVQREIGFSFDLTNPDDAKRFVTALFCLNQRSTILMLEDYHTWLIGKLDAASLHLI